MPPDVAYPLPAGVLAIAGELGGALASSLPPCPRSGSSCHLAPPPPRAGMVSKYPPEATLGRQEALGRAFNFATFAKHRTTGSRDLAVNQSERCTLGYLVLSAR